VRSFPERTKKERLTLTVGSNTPHTGGLDGIKGEKGENLPAQGILFLCFLGAMM
jgi:hypothetical protein